MSQKIDGVAVIVNEDTGEVREVAATADITFHEPETEQARTGTSLGYSRRYADAWDRVFKKETVN